MSNASIDEESAINKITKDYESQIDSLTLLTTNHLPIPEDKLITVYNKLTQQLKVNKSSNHHFSKQKQRLKELRSDSLTFSNTQLKEQIIKYLKKQYSIIDKRIKGNEIQQMTALTTELDDQELQFNNNYSEYTSENETQIKNYHYQDFKLKITQLASTYFQSQCENIYVQFQSVKTKLVSTHTDEIKKTKEEMTSISKTSNERIETMKKQLEAYSLSEVALNEKVKLLIQDVAKEKQRANNISFELKQKYELEIKRLQDKLQKVEENNVINDNKNKMEVSNIDKERKILEMNIANMKKQIEDFKQRETTIHNEYKAQIKEHVDALKQSTGQYENLIKGLNEKIESGSSKSIDMEGSIRTYEQLIEFEKVKNEDLKNKYEHDTMLLNQKLNDQKEKFNTEKKKLMTQLEAKETSIQKLIFDQKDAESEAMFKLKTDEEKLISKSKHIEQLYLTEKQKNEFLMEKEKDLNEQIEQMKMNQDKILNTLNMTKASNGTFNVNNNSIEEKVENLQNIFMKEKNNIENDHKKTLDYYLNEINKQKRDYNSLENKYETAEKELSESKAMLSILTEKNKELSQQNQLTENIRSNFNEELNRQIQITIETFERKLNDKEEYHQEEIIALNKNSENTLNQLKAIFAAEKLRYEERITFAKGKSEQNMKTLISEYELKIKENEREARNELETLQANYDELEANFNQISIGGGHEITLLKQKLATAERIISENKENLVNITKEHNIAIQEKLNAFNVERKEMTMKMDTLQSELNIKEQDIILMNQRIASLEDIIKEKEAEMSSQKKEYETAIEAMISKFEQYKNKQQEIANEFTIKKMDFERETRLLKQQIDFLNNKVEEQVTFVDENDRMHDENINELKTELEETFNHKMTEFLNEKRILNEKVKEAEVQIKSYEDKINAVSSFYEQKLRDEKNNHKMIYSQLESELQNLSMQTEKLNKKSSDPIKRINELMETQTQLQNENAECKDSIIQLEKELDEKETLANRLQNENNDLLQDNETLNSMLTQMKTKYKIASPSNSLGFIDLRKKKSIKK